MHTEIGVDVYGDIEDLWQLASDVERWPVILPHYRYVALLGADGPRRTVEMAARRGWVPVRWRSVVEALPGERRILFEHVGGAARGMAVEWRIVQHDGYVRATIGHDLGDLRYPIVRTRLGRYILAEHFIAPVAGRTLGRMKQLVEAGASAVAAGGVDRARATAGPGTRREEGTIGDPQPL